MSPSPTSLEKCTLKDLKSKCKAYGLKQTGKKNEVLERIQKHLAEHPEQLLTGVVKAFLDGNQQESSGQPIDVQEPESDRAVAAVSQAKQKNTKEEFIIRTEVKLPADAEPPGAPNVDATTTTAAQPSVPKKKANKRKIAPKEENVSTTPTFVSEPLDPPMLLPELGLKSVQLTYTSTAPGNSQDIGGSHSHAMHTSEWCMSKTFDLSCIDPMLCSSWTSDFDLTESAQAAVSIAYNPETRDKVPLADQDSTMLKRKVDVAFSEVEEPIQTPIDGLVCPRKKVKMIVPPSVPIATLHGELMGQAQRIPTKSQETVSLKSIECKSDICTTAVDALAIAIAWTLKYDCSRKEEQELCKILSLVSKAFMFATHKSRQVSSLHSRLFQEWQPSKSAETQFINQKLPEIQDVFQQNLSRFKEHWLADLFKLDQNKIYHENDLLKSVSTCFAREEEFQIVLSAMSSSISRQYLDENLKKDILVLHSNPDIFAVHCSTLSPDLACITDGHGNPGICLSLTGERLGSEINQIRNDWQLLLARYSSSSSSTAPTRLLDQVKFTSHREEDGNWMYGISPTIKKPEKLLIAQRFVVCNAKILDPPPGLNVLPNLSLDSDFGVLSVSTDSHLRGGVAIVTTSGGRSVYVMSDTGRIIGDENYGVEPKFRELLRCDEKGIRLERG